VGTPRSSTAIALSDSSALALDHETLHHLLESNRPVASRIVQQLVLRLRDAEDQIEIMMLRDTQSKIVNALLKLSHNAAAEGRTGVAVQISPMELSTRVGMDVESVKQSIQKLRESGYIRVENERLEVPDLEALRRLFALLGTKDELHGPDPPALATSRNPV
jgi:CRP/FNR family transcriptional regulator, cyclic AMP receptor protein